MSPFEHAEKALNAAIEALENSSPSIVKVEENGKEVKLDTDILLNDIIIKELSKSGIAILSEEEKEQSTDLQNCWIIDPLDGSLNFSRDISLCAISIALIQNGKTTGAFIYDYHHKQKICCIAGKGLSVNGVKQQVANTQKIDEAIICTGFPSRMNYDNSTLALYVDFARQFRKIRMFGSAVQSLLHVAQGKVDCYFEKDIMIWDVAAGLLLVREAGGRCSEFPGSLPNSRVIIACAPAIYQQTLALTKPQL
jgi:myo-inositol-1(or 4)-monophosphatase